MIYTSFSRLKSELVVDTPAMKTKPTMTPLPIVWQRLVDSEGRTCDRCGSTYDELQQAVATLKQVLRPLDIEPTLEIKELNEATFRTDPSQSNRVWIAGKPIEQWLDAKVASSRCDSVCGDSDCRTIELENTTFQTIPSQLILKATLIAAAEFVPANSESRHECQPQSCLDSC